MRDNLLFKKIAVFAAPLAMVVLWEWWLGNARAVIEVGLATISVVVLAVWFLTLRPVAVSQLQTSFHRKEFWRFLITPLLAAFSVYLFLLIIASPFWQQVVILASNLAAVLILQNIFDRFYQTARYPAKSFESISGNVNSASIFLLAVVFYSWSAFLETPTWLLAVLLIAAATFLTYETMWISGLDLKKSWLYVLLIDLILLEFFWVMSFWPSTFYVKALVLTVVYYLSVNLSRNYLIDLLTEKMIWRYLIIGGVILALALGTAQYL